MLKCDNYQGEIMSEKMDVSSHQAVVIKCSSKEFTYEMHLPIGCGIDEAINASAHFTAILSKKKEMAKEEVEDEKKMSNDDLEHKENKS